MGGGPGEVATLSRTDGSASEETKGSARSGRAFGFAQTADKGVGRNLGRPPLTGGAGFQMFVDRFSSGVVELAEAISA